MKIFVVQKCDFEDQWPVSAHYARKWADEEAAKLKAEEKESLAGKIGFARLPHDYVVFEIELKA